MNTNKNNIFASLVIWSPLSYAKHKTRCCSISPRHEHTRPLIGSHGSLWLLFKLLLQYTSLCSSPHVQGAAGGEEKEEDEGYGKAHSVHHTSSQGTKTQFPQDLQSGQKTVVGSLKTHREIYRKH